MLYKYPTEDLMFGARFAAEMEKSTEVSSELPVKKGKVKRRKDGH
jgi:hypothetical protein